jgi:hypothetical protein
MNTGAGSCARGDDGDGALAAWVRPGFRANPPTERQSTIEDEELMLQKRAPPIEVPPPAARRPRPPPRPQSVHYVNVNLF